MRKGGPCDGSPFCNLCPPQSGDPDGYFSYRPVFGGRVFPMGDGARVSIKYDLSIANGEPADQALVCVYSRIAAVLK